MQNTLLIIANELQFNQPYFEYIKRSYKQKVMKIDKIIFIKNSSKELFLIIQECVLKSQNLLIATNQISYKIVSKIISTVTESNLIYENQTLMPSNTIFYSHNSYLIEYQNCKINILKSETLEKLPAILLEDKRIKSFYIFDDDLESVRNFLKPIAKSFDTEFLVTKIVKKLLLIKVCAKNQINLNEFIKSSKRLYQNSLFEENLVSFVVQKLKEKNLKITTAESCTGGLISANITQVSGASEIFDGGFVTYSNEMKTQILGVDEEILKTYGAVSYEVVQLMAKGALKITNSDFAIAVSGVAGPNGGTKEKPVGTIFIAVGDKKVVAVKKLELSGDREYIQTQTAIHCFAFLAEFL